MSEQDDKLQKKLKKIRLRRIRREQKGGYKKEQMGKVKHEWLNDNPEQKKENWTQ